MNDFNIDPDEYHRLVRDAERMRAEALREFLVSVARRLAGLGVSLVHAARSLRGRGKFNQSVPAPHH